MFVCFTGGVWFYVLVLCFVVCIVWTHNVLWAWFGLLCFWGFVDRFLLSWFVGFLLGFDFAFTGVFGWLG